MKLVIRCRLKSTWQLCTLRLLTLTYPHTLGQSPVFGLFLEAIPNLVKRLMLKQECHSVSHVSRTQYKHIHHIKPTDLYFQTLGVSKCSLRLPSLKFTIKDCYMGLNKYGRSYASESWYRLKFQREYVAQLYHAMLSSLAFECFMFTPCVKCALRKVQTESIRVLLSLLCLAFCLEFRKLLSGEKATNSTPSYISTSRRRHKDDLLESFTFMVWLVSTKIIKKYFFVMVKQSIAVGMIPSMQFQTHF